MFMEEGKRIFLEMSQIALMVMSVIILLVGVPMALISGYIYLAVLLGLLSVSFSYIYNLINKFLEKENETN